MVLDAAHSFPKTARLRKRLEFLLLPRTGKKIHTTNFIVVKKKTERTESRLGVTVSSRVGNAVVRNRIKRLVREYFRCNRNQISLPTDCLVIARPGAKELTFKLVGEELHRALIHDRSGRRR